jgi:hypothetical protein
MIISPAGLATKNDFAGEDHQQFNRSGDLLNAKRTQHIKSSHMGLLSTDVV